MSGALARSAVAIRANRAASKCLAASVLLGGCGSGADHPADAFTVSDSAGIRIVESHAPAWGADAPRIDPEPLIHLGSDEPGPFQFGFVGAGLFLADGRFAVSEIYASEVRLFNADGTHAGTFGRGGDGPGEFRNVSALFQYPGDSLAIFDGLLRRTTIVPPTLDGHRTVRSQVEGNFGPFGVLGHGTFLLPNPGSGFHPALPAGLQWDTTDVVAMDASDGAGRVVARLPSREQYVLDDGNTRPLTPAHGSVQAVAAAGFWWATTDRYELRFYDPEGRLARIVRRPVIPNPVEPAMIERYVETLLDRVRQFEGETAVPRYRAQYQEGPFGEHVPLFSRALVDRDQRLWLSGPTWPDFETPPASWSVFAPDGVWLGDVQAPPGLRILDARGNLILGVWEDALGVPHVRLHRLETPSR